MRPPTKNYGQSGSARSARGRYWWRGTRTGEPFRPRRAASWADCTASRRPNAPGNRDRGSSLQLRTWSDGPGRLGPHTIPDRVAIIPMTSRGRDVYGVCVPYVLSQFFIDAEDERLVLLDRATDCPPE